MWGQFPLDGIQMSFSSKLNTLICKVGRVLISQILKNLLFNQENLALKKTASPCVYVIMHSEYCLLHVSLTMKHIFCFWLAGIFNEKRMDLQLFDHTA